MRLSKNFTLDEFIYSQTAIRYGINNYPDEEHITNIQALVDKVLQPLRVLIGPIRISSGYRSVQLNKIIGGSSSSQHCFGQAVDIQFWKKGIKENRIIYDTIINNKFKFDQMINEFDYSWIHISYKKEKNRNHILEAYYDKKGFLQYKFTPEMILL
tara:strand:- start:2372 stop:2839 length:468 start_codon:yes stop_codon:yes gene_type:complete